MMRRHLVLAPVLGMVLLACDTPVVPSPGATPAISALPTATASPAATAPATPEPTTTAFTCDERAESGTLVTYADGGDLFLYDVTDDATRELTTDGDSRYDRTPAFLSAGCLVFSTTEPTSVEILELSAGVSRRTIVEEVGGIASLAVSPDGKSVLYLHIDHDVDSTYRLKRVDIGGGSPEVLHTFEASIGRGAGSDDEVSVAWSPDGSMILVANTHEYSTEFPNGALYIFDAAGEKLLRRWAGTHPRWSPDSATVYYRRYAGPNGQGWRALDVGSMTSTRVGFRPGTNGLSVSPDGRHVAYDTSFFGDLPLDPAITSEAPVVYGYDLMNGDETLFKRGALAALWISPSDVILTNARSPEGPSVNSWESLGTVTRISLNGERTRLDMTSTLFDAAVYRGP